MALVSGLEEARRAALKGATVVQLRSPEASLRELEASALAIRRQLDLPLVISDRADLAAAVGAAGVQLPEAGIPVAAARLVARGAIVGRSVHNPEAALEAEARGADYVVFGAIRPTASHPGAAAAGWEGLAAVAGRLTIPVIAIGGLGEGDLARCLDAGAAGFAAIGFFQA